MGRQPDGGTRLPHARAHRRLTHPAGAQEGRQSGRRCDLDRRDDRGDLPGTRARRRAALKDRSAALHKAVRLLRASELGPAYEKAWEEWFAGDDEKLWAS